MTYYDTEAYKSQLKHVLLGLVDQGYYSIDDYWNFCWKKGVFL
jgi:hypothetical protein